MQRAGSAAAAACEWTVGELPPDAPDPSSSELCQQQTDELTMMCAVYPEMHVRYDAEKRARLMLRMDGEKVQVFVEVLIPAEYPARGALGVTLRSVNASRWVIGELQDKLEEEAGRQFAEDSFALMPLFAFASQLIAELPLELQAEHFGCCPRCNGVQVANGRKKVPQPAEVVPGAGLLKCLRCGTKDIIPIPTMRVNVVDTCSYCFCEDNPLIEFECGCLACMTCFQTMFDLATGSKTIKQNVRSKLYGVPCSNHKNSVICDAGLMKLGEPRAYSRFNQFALEKAATSFDGTTCPMPGCSNHPFLSDVKGGLMRCPYCSTWFCVACHQQVLKCTCEALKASANVNIDHHVYQLHESRAVCPPVFAMPSVVRVLVCTADERVPLELDATCLDWSKTVMQCVPFLSKTYNFEPLYVFSGVVLNPKRPLKEYGVHTGAILFALEFFPMRDDIDRREELDLWHFRRGQGLSVAADASKNDKSVAKPCPYCSVPVVHYLGHGCHHIGFAGESCCGKHWCFVCRDQYPCKNGCGTFCDKDGSCKCPLCPDCRPFRPCNLCSGCPRCIVAIEKNLFD